MKKILILSAIFALFWISCDVLDVDPQHSIPSEQAITNRNDVVRAITGCYDALQFAGYYGRNYVAVADLAADNLNWTGTSAGYNQIDNNSILADNVIVEGIWSSIYTALNRINSVMDRIPEMENLTAADADQFLGELHFLRALAHYDLARYFGAIPLRTAAVSPQDEDLNIPRSSLDAVFTQVFSDIEFAEDNITEQITRGKASLAAVLALKARVSLHNYYHTGNSQMLNQAVASATRVINDFGLELEEEFETLFTGGNNRESIFEVEFNDQDRNRMAEYFFPTDLSGRFEFGPTESLVEALEDDNREEVSISFINDEPYALKYKDIETGTDNVYVFRLAEMHLIRAEANALLGTDHEAVLEDLNPIRQRAGLSLATTSDFGALLLLIEEQRRLEFAFEGHRWFDLVRTGRAIEVLEGITHANQTLFPIPLNEILANDAIGNDDQNPGY